MDIVDNILIENDNCNQTQILVEQFKHFNIEIYGTYEVPLFKAKDIGDLLEIKNINSTLRDFKDNEKGLHSIHTLGGIQDITFLTEKGLYKVLMRSRKKIAEQFQDWVFELIQKIRLNSDNLLREKLTESDNKFIKSQKELEFYKEKTFEQVLLDQTLYTMSTDKENVFKVGKTDKSNAKVRKGQLQTGCVDDILILFEFKTSNCNLLENLVHYALKRYQSNSGREHFHCNLDYIKLVINICGKFVNTIGSMYQNITHEQFTDKISYNIPIQNIPNTQIIKKVQEIKKPYVKYIKPTPFSIDECTQNTQDIIDELFPDLIQEISTTRNLIQEIS